MNLKKKILLVVIDGLADEPIADFGFKTPLEFAKTPVFDSWMAGGLYGQVKPYCKNGQLPTSEDSHLALFGYDPQKESPGRGVLEALGLGLKVKEGQVFLRGNFATLNEEGQIVDRRAERIQDTQELVKSIDGMEIEGIKINVFKSWQHRVVVLLEGKGLSANVTDGDTKEINTAPPPILPKDNSKEAKFTAEVLEEFLKRVKYILAQHPFNIKRQREGYLPANTLLLRGAGTLKRVKNFQELYGFLACCIAGAPLYKGIGKFLGMELIEVPGANGRPNTNIAGKFSAAISNLEKYDFIFVHIKAADTFGEDGDWEGKKNFIEKIDRSAVLLNEVVDRVSIVVTADHATCSLRAKHCNNLVPILLAKRAKSSDLKFGESFCQKGKLGTIEQLEVMPTILKYLKA